MNAATARNTTIFRETGSRRIVLLFLYDFPKKNRCPVFFCLSLSKMGSVINLANKGGSQVEGFRGTTIFAIRHKGAGAIVGDGQVTFGNQMVMKHRAKKVRRLYRGKVVAGFAGSVADAMTLFEKFEGKLEEFHGNLTRAAVELAKEWRADKVLRRLEAMLIVMDAEHLLLVSGTGEVIEPDDQMLAIGSGGGYALAAGRALKRHAPEMSAREIAEAALRIAGEICVFTNQHIVVEEV